MAKVRFRCCICALEPWLRLATPKGSGFDADRSAPVGMAEAAIGAEDDGAAAVPACSCPACSSCIRCRDCVCCAGDEDDDDALVTAVRQKKKNREMDDAKRP